uniref:Zn_ribbon_recom domain-containing protein n=1 Tax=Strongyloides papillosus TaxID=174720 RepID=A0A0N5BYV8_STREA
MIPNAKELRITYNGNLLSEQSLIKLGLLKKNGSTLVMKKILTDILMDKSMLEYDNTNDDHTKPLPTRVMNNLYDHGFFNFDNRCHIKGIILSFYGAKQFVALEEEFYRKFLDEMKFKNNLAVVNNSKRYLIKIILRCSKCGTVHENNIEYDKFDRVVCIHLL